MSTRERTILRAYFGQPSPALDSAIAALDLDGQAREGTPSTLDAAVAAVLLQGVLSSLPQWAANFAIGSFDIARPLFDGAQEIIVTDWARQAKMGQCRWAYLFDEGLVDTALSESWADEVRWRDDEVGDDADP